METEARLWKATKGFESSHVMASALVVATWPGQAVRLAGLGRESTRQLATFAERLDLRAISLSVRWQRQHAPLWRFAIDMGPSDLHCDHFLVNDEDRKARA